MAKKTILIVDDIAFVRKTLVEILTQSHYQVIGEALDGTQAVEMYQILQPNLVTMDVVMPQMSGIEATRRILKIDQNAIILMISAMGQEHLVMEAIHAGAKDYLSKPFSASQLLHALDQLFLK